MMKRVFNFGKIDYYHTGRKTNLVEVEMSYTEKDDKKIFSVSGKIWNSRKTDIVCGGQCLDEIAEYIKTPLFKTIHRLWKQYHLNDMHLECEHQAATFTPTPEQTHMALLKYSLTTPTSTLPENISQYYEPKKPLYRGDTEHTERKKRGFLREEEHPDGILCKPCPVCGYKYGTSWNYFPVPRDDEQIILNLLKGEQP